MSSLPSLATADPGASSILQGRGWSDGPEEGDAAVAAQPTPQSTHSTSSRKNGASLANGSALPPDLSTPSGPIARAGDLIIVQERYDSITQLVLLPTGVLHNRYGRFLHSDVIGHPLGRRWDSVDCPPRSVAKPTASTPRIRGFIYALPASPALWSYAMPHRTQVVYPPDAAIIALYLDLRPGSTVVESGTGAGSASVAFARTIAPHGKLLSFEFHRERADAAAAEFAALGLGDVITVHPGVDVLSDGFPGVPDGGADAVFLDLPAPYGVIREVARVLRPDGAVCSFSPCIEQVQRACAELAARQLFHSVRTVTAPMRTYETRPLRHEAPGFDSLGNGRRHPRARAGSDVGEGEGEKDQARKKRKFGRSAAGERSLLQAEAAAKEGGGEGDGDEPQPFGLVGRVVRPDVAIKARPFAEMKGHTSYLTFARRTRTELPPEVDEVEGNGKVRAAEDGSHCVIA